MDFFNILLVAVACCGSAKEAALDGTVIRAIKRKEIAAKPLRK